MISAKDPATILKHVCSPKVGAGVAAVVVPMVAEAEGRVAEEAEGPALAVTSAEADTIRHHSTKLKRGKLFGFPLSVPRGHGIYLARNLDAFSASTLPLSHFLAASPTRSMRTVVILSPCAMASTTF